MKTVNEILTDALNEIAETHGLAITLVEADYINHTLRSGEDRPVIQSIRVSSDVMR